MTLLKSLAITVGILAVIILSSALVSPNVGRLLAVATAGWAAIDSRKFNLRQYKTGIAYGPVVLFFGVALLWIIGFPWYLVVRDKIKHGTLPLKNPSAASLQPEAP